MHGFRMVGSNDLHTCNWDDYVVSPYSLVTVEGAWVSMLAADAGIHVACGEPHPYAVRLDGMTCVSLCSVELQLHRWCMYKGRNGENGSYCLGKNGTMRRWNERV